MIIGKLRHRVTIQTYSESTNSYGETSKSWSDQATVWASVEPLSGRELEYAQQVHAQTTTKIVMRWRSISTKQRISFNGQTYEILSVLNPEERNIKAVCLCVEED